MQIDYNKEINSQDYYELGKYKEYFTSELKAYKAQYSDPLTLNFKLLIDFDATVGLLANETNINSALAYLKRIGEDLRYEMLKQWISVFQIFIKDYDFLILEAAGLDVILNARPAHSFMEDNDKIEIKIRETSDMLIQGLLTTYRTIWFDDTRGVEVLPANLRRFDSSILVFSSGYFDMLLYDTDYSGYDYIGDKVKNNEKLSPSEIERIIFPTIKKLNDNNYINKGAEKYNHLIFNLNDCSINNEESGKSFVETVTNESSDDFIKNNLVLNFRFANYSGRFNNIMGNIDFTGLLTILATQNKSINSLTKDKTTFGGLLKSQLSNTFSDFKNGLTGGDQMFNNLKTATTDTLKNKSLNQLSKLTSKNSVVGNLLSQLSVENAQNMIQNTLNLGINKIEEKIINDPIAKVNNMLFQNFSNNLIDIYKNSIQDNSTNKNIELSVNETIPTEPNGNNTGITFGISNIYNRRGF